MQAPNKNKDENKSAGAEALEAADRLHSAAIHLLRRLRVRDRELGIGPAQLSALSVLVFAGPGSLAGLAEAEQVTPPTMSRIVAGLLREKLVHKRTDRKDRRAVIIEATEKGVRIMHEGRRRRVEALAAGVRAQPQKEIAQLRKAARVMELLSREA
jgi:DNA-binding MarR family transcriptional regulator